MNGIIVNILTRAIKLRKPVEFEYIKEGKIPGRRVGNPHIIFSGHMQSGASRIWAHIVQTGGVSDSGGLLPDWRMFIVEYIHNLRILEDWATFEIFEGYRPDSEFYAGTQIIAKV